MSAAPSRHRRGRVPLARALSKLGLASRAQALDWIRAGRVAIDGRVVTDAALMVVPESVRVTIDGVAQRVGKPAPRLIAFHKPRSTVTTTRDPQGRRTVFDVLGDAGRGLRAVGRLDYASTGLLLLTNDPALADALTDPRHRVVRRYVVTVRGRVSDEMARRLETGIDARAAAGGTERLQAATVTIRKTSNRETHLVVELTEGRNREIRRLFDATGHEVTRLHRITYGKFELGDLRPGDWREERGEGVGGRGRSRVGAGSE
ncbi:MAG TPA: pseudouridine synthase [Vicinamibacterales bacterium]|nr:pseudouridine synthase [Vicinamibacterales bacterium]